MKIHHRGIYQDRFDTPFGVGTMIWAQDCHKHCPGCFHQDRFGMPIIEEDTESIIAKVQESQFSVGIVLGGFEWTEQYEELLSLIGDAYNAGLEIILYTHHTIEEITEHYTELLDYQNIYIKCGEYDESCLDPNYSSYGVPLASTNQKIYRVGYDV